MSAILGDDPADDGESFGYDYSLTHDEIRRLLRAIAQVFTTEARALILLEDMGFPREMIPTWGLSETPLHYWSQIFTDLGNDLIATPYRRLLASARSYYGYQAFADLERRLQERETAAAQAAAAQPACEPGAESEPGPGPEQAGDVGQTPAPEPESTCHLVAWIEVGEERADLESWLADQGLNPQRVWSTVSSVSYRVSETDPQALDRRLADEQCDFPWAVVPPGRPDYVLRFLNIEGPDGRSFRFSDVPSATPVSSVVRDLFEQYGSELPGVEDQTAAVDFVGTDGPRRMNPDNTVGDEGLADGDRLRIGFERRAAAVNPLDRRDALFRVRNQLLQYAESHPGFIVTPNSPALPTEYDIEFVQPSFGPPKADGGEPTDIGLHQLSIVLPPDFPVVAPRVRWLTEIFHPNVYPAYESEALRAYPYMRGVVCLGTLAESYQPSLDFGELVATLQDIACYRNYSLVVPADDRVDDATGQPLLQRDYYDERAAWWASSPSGQERIRGIGGAPVFRMRPTRSARYRFEIERDVTEPEEAELDQIELDL